MRFPATCGGVLAILLAAAPALTADEVEDLLARVNPPERFARHAPEFSAVPQEFRFVNAAGPYKETLWVLRDGGRTIGLYSPPLGQVELFTHDPAQGREKLELGPRYHLARMFGTRITTRLAIAPMERFEYEFDSSGRELKFHETNYWAVAGRQGLGANARSTCAITLRLDPICGYTIDLDCRLVLDQIPKDKGGKPMKEAEWCSMLPGHVSDVWPGRWRYDQTVFSPLGLPPGSFRGWWNNLAACDHSDDDPAKMKVREGGLVAFLAGKDGWAPALARSGPYGYSLATGSVWQDQQNRAALPEKPDADGQYRMNPKFRLVFLPPEVAAVVLKNTQIDDFNGARAVMVRLGADETFEDQPLPYTTPVRGCYPVGEVTDQQAHSGKKSLVIKAVPRAEADRRLPGFIPAPQVPLDENATYRITAWIMMDGNGEAFISADLYDATPSKPDRVLRQRTPPVTASKEWKEVTLEFRTPAFDPFIDLRFICIGAGQAYFDDFSLVKVQGTGPAAAPKTH